MVSANADNTFERDLSEFEKLKADFGFLEKHMVESFIFLESTDSSSRHFMTWKIVDANTATTKLLGKDKAALIDTTLLDHLSPEFDFKLPEKLEKGYQEEFSLLMLNTNQHFSFTLIAMETGNLACKILDVSDSIKTQAELNKNLQRNELITEILGIFNDEETLGHKFDKILTRVNYHFHPQRALVLEHAKNQSKAILLSQMTTQGEAGFPENFEIPLMKIPSWISILKERNMVLGFSLSYLPKDMQEYFKYIKLDNAYIFPIWVENELYGSILFENIKGQQWDNTEINYLKLISAIISNLTANEINEKELLESKEKAEESDRLKTAFLANMSHDIRIPMNAIIGFSDLLADPDLTIGEREEFIDMISGSGKDLLTLIDNIIDVAKIESGQLSVKKEPYQLKNILNDVLEEHRYEDKLMMRDDLSLLLDFDIRYEKLELDTDIFRFKQVLSNLIENSIKFTETGHVKFGISSLWGETIEFYVEDTGIGISVDAQEAIFERFSKVDHSYAREYNGTGLGLAICKSLVGLLGGDIRVVSELGKGSTFYFTHPCKLLEKEIVQGVLKEEDDFEYNWIGKKILIAEDVEQNYMYLGFLIEPTKAEVTWVKNGKEAVEFFEGGGQVDLVLMDIRMPIMSGIDATRRIMDITSVPIVAQTAYTLGNEKDMAIEAGCVDYLSKPIDSEQFYKRVNALIS
jgi:signal transduction histidine kinase/CheY-like chemotaxis protein